MKWFFRNNEIADRTYCSEEELLRVGDSKPIVGAEMPDGRWVVYDHIVAKHPNLNAFYGVCKDGYSLREFTVA